MPERTKEAYELWIHRFFAFQSDSSILSEIKETVTQFILIHTGTVRR